MDHRSFADRGIELIPEIHLGFSMKFLPSDYLPLKAQELDRLREYLSIRRQNGRLILEDPDRALKYLAHHDVVFREKDIDNFTRVHTIDEKQFGQVKAALMASSRTRRDRREREGRETLYDSNDAAEREGDALPDG